MVTINDRIRAIATYYGINSYAEFARITGLGHQVVSNYFKDRQRPDVRKLSKIKQAFEEVDAHWLITGEGDMLKRQIHISPACKVDYKKGEKEKLSKLSTAGILRYFTKDGTDHFKRDKAFTHHIQRLAADYSKILSRRQQLKNKDGSSDDKPDSA